MHQPPAGVSPRARSSDPHGDLRTSVEPLPTPDNTAPRQTLARILDDSGLELRGVDLVYAR